MSKCYSARCQQDRKIIRRELNKWTKNILLQIGLETISKNHFEFDANSFKQIDGYEEIPSDFNPDENCLFCLTRQESSPSIKQPILNDDENSPLDLSLKSTSNYPSSTVFDVKSDILPMYNSNDYFLLNSMNFDYFSHLNQYSSVPMNNTYSSNSLLEENYFNEFIKQMAYLRMIQEIEFQRTNSKSNETTNQYHPSTSILTDSVHMNDIVQEIMSKTLNDIFKEQNQISKPNDSVSIPKSNQDDSNTKKQKPNQTSNSSKRRSKESNSNFDGKHIRPKRGQYRRYETEQLSKAVAAVLSNEMSVHRAGSFFGVPHSTLEYKVKERNSKSKDSKFQKKHDDTDQSQSKNSNMNSSPIESQSDDEDIQPYIPIET